MPQAHEVWTAAITRSLLGPVVANVRKRGGPRMLAANAPVHVRRFLALPDDTSKPQVMEGISWDNVCQIKPDPGPPDRVDKVRVITHSRYTGRVVLTLHLNKPSVMKPSKPLPTLECMRTHSDGAHCGLSDWYPEIEQGIVEALARGRRAEWTTGWYASKKEIASACISHAHGQIHVEVSVSDDFDSEGIGDAQIPHTTKLDRLESAIDKAWDEANRNLRDNALYAGFSVLNKKKEWVETVIVPQGDGHMMDEPPGDSYSAWGWQGDSDIPADVKRKFDAWIGDMNDGVLTYKGWTLKPWE